MPKRLARRLARDPAFDAMAKTLADHMVARGGEPGPWWTRRIDQWGPTLVFAAVVFAVLMDWVPSPFSRLTHIDDIQKSLEAHQAAMLLQASKDAVRAEEEARILRNICRSVAKSDVTREGCDR